MIRLAIPFAVCLFAAAQGHAGDEAAAPVELYWRHSTVLRVSGAAKAVVLDESVCQAEVSEDRVKIVGLARGESLVIVWAGDQRFSYLVRVTAEPSKPAEPSLGGSAAGESIHGLYGPSLQVANTSAGTPDYLLVQRISFSQDLQGNRLSVQGQVQDQYGAGVPSFNLNTASIQYSSARYRVSLVDTVVEMNGGMRARMLPGVPSLNSVLLRGAELDFRRGPDEFGFFAGATVPAYYLDFAASRALFGFNFARKASPNLQLYATSAGTTVPLPAPGGSWVRRADAFQTAGFVLRLNDRWTIQSTGGVSTAGGMAQGTVLYSRPGRTAYFSMTRSAADFPLNQLQLLPAGRSSVTAGAEQDFSRGASAAVFYQYSSTLSNALFVSPAASDYFSQNLNLAVSDRHRMTLNYTFTRHRGWSAAGSQTAGHRGDVQLSSQITPWLGNSAEFQAGSLTDPLQLNAASQFSLREAVNFRLFAGNTMFLTLSHDGQDPSLVNRLAGELGLLSPALQQLFRQDPVGFVGSPGLTPEIRALLSNLQPTNTQVTLSGQFAVRRRLTVSPQIGYFRAGKGLAENSRTYSAGYALTCQLTPGLQLQSSLSNMMLWDSMSRGLRRDTVFGFGLNIALHGDPRRLVPFRPPRGTIRGRVYRDLNINGAFNAGEPGFAGIRVDLGDGRSTLTDAAGRFEFAHLDAGHHHVSLGLAQFNAPVRVTSPTEVDADLSANKVVEIDFGVVNFSRVQGNVFNDYVMNGIRQPDAPPVPGVRLVLKSGALSREVAADGSGDFEFDELSPGGYTLTVDSAGVPPNFACPRVAFEFQVAPNSTVVSDIPLQALRSISGRVLMKVADPGSAPQPVAGAKIALAGRSASTDAEGRFVLRNLPAGRWSLEMVPAAPAPDGIKMPSAPVELPRDPIQAQGAAIVISNPELLKYLVPPSPERAAAAGLGPR